MALTISKKGWVVIPAELRKKYNLTPGKSVQIIDYGGVLAIVPSLEDPVRESMGMLSREGSSITQALLEEHRQELESER